MNVIVKLTWDVHYLLQSLELNFWFQHNSYVLLIDKGSLQIDCCPVLMPFEFAIRSGAVLMVSSMRLV